MSLRTLFSTVRVHPLSTQRLFERLVSPIALAGKANACLGESGVPVTIMPMKTRIRRILKLVLLIPTSFTGALEGGAVVTLVVTITQAKVTDNMICDVNVPTVIKQMMAPKRPPRASPSRTIEKEPPSQVFFSVIAISAYEYVVLGVWATLSPADTTVVVPGLASEFDDS